MCVVVTRGLPNFFLAHEQGLDVSAAAAAGPVLPHVELILEVEGHARFECRGRHGESRRQPMSPRPRMTSMMASMWSVSRPFVVACSRYTTSGTSGVVETMRGRDFFKEDHVLPTSLHQTTRQRSQVVPNHFVTRESGPICRCGYLQSIQMGYGQRLTQCC